MRVRPVLAQLLILLAGLVVAGLACGTNASQRRETPATATTFTPRPDAQRRSVTSTRPAEASCAGTTVDSDAVTVSVGQRFTIPVRSGTFPPQVGELVLAPEPDAQVVRLVDTRYPQSALLGLKLSCWTFEAVGRGRTTISFAWYFPAQSASSPGATPQGGDHAPRVTVTVS